MDLEQLKQMKIEQESWMELCKYFEKTTTFSVNHPRYKKLIPLILIWGEQLAILRREQGEEGLRFSEKVIKENQGV